MKNEQLAAIILMAVKTINETKSIQPTVKKAAIIQPKQPAKPTAEPFQVTDNFVIGTAINRKGQVNHWAAWLSNQRHVNSAGQIMKQLVVDRSTNKPYTVNWSSFNGEGVIDGHAVKIVNGFVVTVPAVVTERHAIYHAV